MHGGRAALGVHRPLRPVAADRLSELLRSFGEQIAKPSFATRRHIEQLIDGINVAPFELQSVGFVRSEQAFLPRLQRYAGATGKMAALDAEIVDAFGEIK